ncbi:MAG: hypothetical protein ACUVUR_08180 [bacterium]
MGRKYLWTFIISALILMGGCRRRSSDFYPLLPNSVRVMQVTERRVVGVDTTVKTGVKVVEVVRGIMEIPRLGKVWVVERPLDSLHSTRHFYDRHGDTIFKLIPGRGGFPERIVYLIQPLAVGRKWFDTEQERELTEVVCQEQVTVPAGSFADCFRLETKSSKVNFHQTLWLASGLGVVKREKQQLWNKGDTCFEIFQREELVEYRIVRSGK